MSATCRSCGAAIVWTITEHGRRMPVDAEPVRGGNIVLIPGETPVSAYVPGVETVERYVSHFATCPNAAQHRKRGAA